MTRRAYITDITVEYVCPVCGDELEAELAHGLDLPDGPVIKEADPGCLGPYSPEELAERDRRIFAAYWKQQEADFDRANA